MLYSDYYIDGSANRRKRHLFYGDSRNYHNTADTFFKRHGIEKSFQNGAMVTRNGYGNFIEGDTQVGDIFYIYADIYSSKDPENVNILILLLTARVSF